jgi:hypothetical protein
MEIYDDDSVEWWLGHVEVERLRLGMDDHGGGGLPRPGWWAKAPERRATMRWRAGHIGKGEPTRG